ncbi:MAG: Uma2 family endonuclease [Planctomycetota bacterium]|nr:Uma2 family endonuclease [Planctomycetota bacterium]
MRTDIKFNYSDYRALPEGGKRYQLIDGELLVSPSPKTRHQELSSRLYMALQVFVSNQKLGRVYYAPLDVILTDEDVVQPDVFFVSAARAAIVREEGVFGAPDLCVEILSKSSREIDRDVKRKLYARHGATEYWIVDPDADLVQLFRLQEDPERPLRACGSGDTLVSPLFPGFELPLGAVFAR